MEKRIFKKNLCSPPILHSNSQDKNMFFSTKISKKVRWDKFEKMLRKQTQNQKIEISQNELILKPWKKFSISYYFFSVKRTTWIRKITGRNVYKKSKNLCKGVSDVNSQ